MGNQSSREFFRAVSKGEDMVVKGGVMAELAGLAGKVAVKKKELVLEGGDNCPTPWAGYGWPA